MFLAGIRHGQKMEADKVCQEFQKKSKKGGSITKYGNVRYINRFTMATTLAQTGLLQHPFIHTYLLTIETACFNLHLIQMQLLIRGELKNNSPLRGQVFTLLFVFPCL
jgi:hypothetical protein